MKAYILSVICAAFLCAIVSAMVDKKSTVGVILKLICGIFLTFTVVKPITEIQLNDLDFLSWDLAQEAEAVSNMGASQAQSELTAIINRELCAYILDKAQDFGGTLSVEVSLDDACIPVSVVLTGTISSAGKDKLIQILIEDLGIAKENQIWNVS